MGMLEPGSVANALVGETLGLRVTLLLRLLGRLVGRLRGHAFGLSGMVAAWLCKEVLLTRDARPSTTGERWVAGANSGEPVKRMGGSMALG